MPLRPFLRLLERLECLPIDTLNQHLVVALAHELGLDKDQVPAPVLWALQLPGRRQQRVVSFSGGWAAARHVSSLLFACLGRPWTALTCAPRPSRLVCLGPSACAPP